MKYIEFSIFTFRVRISPYANPTGTLGFFNRGLFSQKREVISNFHRDFAMIHANHSVFNYLAIGEIDKIWGLHVTGCGSADVPPESPYPPTEHPERYMFDFQRGRVLSEFQMLYVTHGKGIFESKEVGRKKVGEGTMFVMFPGVWHRYMPDRNTGWKEYWVSFDGAQPEAFRSHGILSPHRPVLDIGLNESIIQLYQQILQLLESERIGFKESIAALTYQLVAAVYSIEKSQKFGGDEIHPMIQRVSAYLRDHLDQRIDFHTLSGELGMGHSWFRRTFRHHTSLAPTQYLLQLKLSKAKELLVSTSLPIKQIASLTGFESQYYFSKFFKKRTGMSPLRWRGYTRTGVPSDNVTV